MAVIKTAFSLLTVAIPNPHKAGMVCAQRFEQSLAANPTAGDVMELGVLPAGCKIVDMILDADDLDTNNTPTIAFDVGIMSGEVGSTDGARTCDSTFFATLNAGQSGATARPSLKSAFRVGAVEVDRSIGVKFTTAAATFAAGKIGLTILYTSA